MQKHKRNIVKQIKQSEYRGPSVAMAMTLWRFPEDGGNGLEAALEAGHCPRLCLALNAQTIKMAPAAACPAVPLRMWTASLIGSIGRACQAPSVHGPLA